MLHRALITAVVGLTLSGGGLIYGGGSPKRTHWMEIHFMLVRGGTRANWDVNVYGPCSDGSQLGRTIGTQVQPPEPLLRLRDGRFTLHHAAAVETTGISYVYTLRGRRVPGGFAGTFDYVEHDRTGAPTANTCASTFLHWKARRTNVFG